MMQFFEISVKVNQFRDGFKDEAWPSFSASMLPRLGETVKGSSGRCLKVTSIIHGEEIDRVRHMSTRTVEIVLD